MNEGAAHAAPSFERGGGSVTLDSLVRDMVEAAENYPGINLIWYRTAVETTSVVVSTFVGIALYSVILCSSLIVALELMFLNFPPMTAALVERESNPTEKKRRNWGLFVNDARKALRIQAETGGADSINVVYFKIKWKTLAIVTGIVNLLFFGGDAIIAGVTKVCGYLLASIAA
jgi:hypothetical protein